MRTPGRGQHRARDGGGRGFPSEPAPRPPLPSEEEPDIPLPEIVLGQILANADEVRARLDEQLDRSLRVIRGEAPGE